MLRVPRELRHALTYSRFGGGGVFTRQQPQLASSVPRKLDFWFLDNVVLGNQLADLLVGLYYTKYSCSAPWA
jgi:hypothetical protein